MASGKNTGSKKKSTGASDKNEKQHGNNIGDEVGAATSEATESVQGAAGELTQNFRQQITGQITTQQERAVDTLDTVTLLLQQAGEHARREEKATIAQYTDQAAEQVERLSSTIRDREPDQLLSETKQLAQKQPGWFVGGALLAGFLGARFLRSSTQSQQETDNQQEATQSNGSASNEQSTDAADYGLSSGPYGAASVPSGVTEGDTSAAPGVSDTTGLEGTLLEEDAAILEELEREELLREEEAGPGGTSTDDAFGTGNGSETR